MHSWNISEPGFLVACSVFMDVDIHGVFVTFK